MHSGLDKQLIQRAYEAAKPRKLSSTAESGSVGCALMTDNQTIYTGVCIDTSSSMGFCAEHNAIGQMITNGESKIISIVAVNWNGDIYPPCGRCREFIYQINNQNIETRILLPKNRVRILRDLLPELYIPA